MHLYVQMVWQVVRNKVSGSALITTAEHCSNVFPSTFN